MTDFWKPRYFSKTGTLLDDTQHKSDRSILGVGDHKQCLVGANIACALYQPEVRRVRSQLPLTPLKARQVNSNLPVGLDNWGTLLEQSAMSTWIPGLPQLPVGCGMRRMLRKDEWSLELLFTQSDELKKAEVELSRLEICWVRHTDRREPLHRADQILFRIWFPLIMPRHSPGFDHSSSAPLQGPQQKLFTHFLFKKHLQVLP